MPPQAHPQLHLVVATLSGSLAEMLGALDHLEPGCNAAEARLDHLWPSVPDADDGAAQLGALLDRFPSHVLPVATLRPERAGGRFEGDEAIRLNLLVAAGRCGFDLVDLEHDATVGPALEALRSQGTSFLASDHAPATPGRDESRQRLQTLSDDGGRLAKYAFPTGSFADALRALELTRLSATRHGRPAVCPLGATAVPERALLAVVGNHATYGAAPGTHPAAPGQPQLHDILALWRHWGLDPTDPQDLCGPNRPAPPWFAVIGHPVDHSLSPRMHNAALRATHHGGRMGAWDVPASGAALRMALMVAPRLGLAGASVTAPHKQDAARIAYGDHVVQATGAANCLRLGVNPNGDGTEPAFLATNTDATGLRRTLGEALGPGGSCVVLGSGGAARAAIWAAQALGAQATFTSRDAPRAAELARTSGATWRPWAQRQSLRADAWVQATPLGAPGDPCPVPAAQLRGAQIAIEMVYRDGDTPFQAAANEAGCHVVGGKTMLFEQGVDAFAYWTGTPTPEPARRAMAAALGVARREVPA